MTRINPKASDPNRQPYATIFIHADVLDNARRLVNSLVDAGTLSYEDAAPLRDLVDPRPGVDAFGYQPNVRRSYLLSRS